MFYMGWVKILSFTSTKYAPIIKSFHNYFLAYHVHILHIWTDLVYIYLYFIGQHR